jgi:hypothetical protein
MTDEILDSLIDWLEEDLDDRARPGIAAQDSEFLVNYWKGLTPDGRRFLAFGDDEWFERFQKSQLT